MFAKLRARLLNALLVRVGARSEEYVKDAIQTAVARAAEQAGQVGFAQGQQHGYQVGLAQGERAGRDALALELQIRHGMYEGGERQMTKEDLENLRIRQVH